MPSSLWYFSKWKLLSSKSNTSYSICAVKIDFHMCNNSYYYTYHWSYCTCSLQSMIIVLIEISCVIYESYTFISESDITKRYNRQDFYNHRLTFPSFNRQLIDSTLNFEVDSLEIEKANLSFLPATPLIYNAIYTCFIR